MKKLDKLGRKIPEFDRSAANKKGAKTRKEKSGENIYSQIGAIGGRASARGHFGKLKEENPEELKRISDQAIRAKQTKQEEAVLREAAE